MDLHVEKLGDSPTELTTPGPIDPVKSNEFKFIAMLRKDCSQDMSSVCCALPVISVGLSHKISQDSFINDLCNSYNL